MKRPDGVTVIAIYQFITAIPLLIGGCAIVLVPISGALAGADRTGTVWALFGLGLALVLTAGGGILSIVAGWGLLSLKNWARWLTIVLAVPSLVGFPIFTLIGGLIIWYLLQNSVRLAFEGEMDEIETVAVPADESSEDEE